jgi:nucleotide-binding universal stress UspA family protein
MKRILVPVDFSPNTEITCQYALLIAESCGAEIILFHSFFDQIYFSDGGFSTSFESGIMLTDEIILDFYRQKEAKLKETAEAMESSVFHPDKAGVRVTAKMESGDPEIQILNAIQLLKPDLIIMGSSGMGKKNLFSGSVARRIIHHTEVPVIAIPHAERSQKIKNVAYMTTFDASDTNAILEVDNLFAPFHIKISCVHLANKDEETESRTKLRALSENQALSVLGERISFAVLDYHPDLDTLRDFLHENAIDLISFIPHKRNALKSLFYQGITKEDLFQTHVPVMAVKPAGQIDDAEDDRDNQI